MTFPYKTGDATATHKKERGQMRLIVSSILLVQFFIVSVITCNEKKAASIFDLSRFENVSFDSSMGVTEDESYDFSQKKLPLAELNKLFKFLKKLYAKNNLTQLKPQKNPIIPKIIHQIWLGPNNPPENFKYLKKTIKKYHPDWKYILWRDKDIPQLNLVNQKYYDETTNPGEKANIVRYEVLYKFGGVYLDVDIESINSLDILHHVYDYYTGICPLDCVAVINNAVIGSAPGHPILKDCIETIKEDWHLSNVPRRSGAQHFTLSFWRAASKYDGRAIALPKSYFYPLNKTDKEDLENLPKHIKKESFTIHYWAGTWGHNFFKEVKNILHEVITGLKAGVLRQITP